MELLQQTKTFARRGDFINNTTLTTGNLGITANNFNNTGTITANKITASSSQFQGFAVIALT